MDRAMWTILKLLLKDPVCTYNILLSPICLVIKKIFLFITVNFDHEGNFFKKIITPFFEKYKSF